MAFKGGDVGEQKQTGYTFKGMPILLSKTRGKPPTGKMAVGKSGWWSEKKRIEALTVFAATGNITKVEELTGVPKNTVTQWVKQPWGRDLLEEIRAENDQAIDAMFTGVMHSALGQVQDRLDNGDEVVLKSGKVIRKKINGKDLSQIVATNLDRRQLLRGKPTSRSETVVEGNRLKKLEEMFLKLAKPTKKPELIVQDIEFTEVVSEPQEPSNAA